jgi:hypothetical protein
MTTQFYEYPGGNYVCEECLKIDLSDTKLGRLKGDEAVTKDMAKLLPDPEHNAYQCDGCLTQSEGYDEAIDEDGDE